MVVEETRLAWWQIRARLRREREQRLRDTYNAVLVEIWVTPGWSSLTLADLVKSTGCRRRDVAVVLRGLQHEGHVRESYDKRGTAVFVPDIV